MTLLHSQKALEENPVEFKSTLVDPPPYLNVQLLYLFVHPLLNGLPNLVRPGAEDVAAGDVVVVDHLR